MICTGCTHRGALYAARAPSGILRAPESMYEAVTCILWSVSGVPTFLVRQHDAIIEQSEYHATFEWRLTIYQM